MHFLLKNILTEHFSGAKKFSQVVVIIFLLAGLAWSVVGFVWIFGVRRGRKCMHVRGWN